MSVTGSFFLRSMRRFIAQRYAGSIKEATNDIGVGNG